MKPLRLSLLASTALVAACTSASRPRSQVPTSPAPQAASSKPPVSPIASNAEPPPESPSKEAPFPPIKHERLANGLELRVVERTRLPVVDVRLIVFSGQATDTDKPGLAAVAGELLKAGGAGRWSRKDLIEEAERLGGELSVDTDRDATSVSISVAARDFEHALDLVAAVAEAPRFDAGEFTKLKQRETERVTSLSRTSPSWMASMILYRELFRLPANVHPYAQYDATPASIAKIGLGDCRAWHRTHFVPSNAVLVVAGQVSQSDVKMAAQKVFGRWKGVQPAPLAFQAPLLPERPSVFLVNRPHSPQAQIYVATLGPERKSADWPALKAANQILGGGVSGRLFLDVREKRSLAYSTSSSVEEVAHGPVPILLSAGTQTAKAGLAVTGLLEHLKRIGTTTPAPQEVATATRYLSDSFAISMETTRAIAGLTGRLAVLGLPDDYYDDYRAAVRSVRAARVTEVSASYFKEGRDIIVVAGDAERLTRPLSHFGPVSVVDPEHSFTTERVVPQDPAAPLVEPATAPR